MEWLHRDVTIVRRTRVVLSFVVLWCLYQSAEGLGVHWLHSFPVQAALMSACLLAAWPLSRWLGFRGYGAYALDVRHWHTWLPIGLLLAVLAKFVAVWLGLHLGVYAVGMPKPTDGGHWPALLAALPLLLISTFVPSLAEDIITRGFWYRAAGLRWCGGTAFVLVSSAIYLLNHIYRLANGPPEWLMLFSFGLVYATALWRTGSLWAALGLHWGWNLGNGLVAATTGIHTLDSQAAVFLSIGAHVLLLALICALPPLHTQPRATAE